MVSVIIAIYNVAEYLPDCLDSVLNQSFSDLEILCVNDGSTDNSLSILEEYSRKDIRIKVINKANGGLSDARNAGMDAASGNYLAFLDGDDAYEQDHIANLLSSIENHASALACCNYSYYFPNTANKEPRMLLSGLPELLEQEDAIKAYLQQQITGSSVIKLYKRSICEGHNLRFPKGQLWEDMTFTLNYLLHIDKVSIVHQSLYNYRQTAESISRTKDTLNILDQLVAVNNGIARIQTAFPGEFEREVRCYLTRAFICVLVYSFKCTDKQILRQIQSAMEKENDRLSLAGLSLSEKTLVILYLLHYPLARFVFLKIYKRSKQ